MVENLTDNELVDLLCENGIFYVGSRAESIARVRRLGDSDRIVREYVARKNAERHEEQEEPVEVTIGNSNENDCSARECVVARKDAAERASELEKLRREKDELERRFNQMIDSVTGVLNSCRDSTPTPTTSDECSQQSTSASTNNRQEAPSTSTSQTPPSNVQLEMDDSNERRASNQSRSPEASNSSERHPANTLNEQQLKRSFESVIANLYRANCNIDSLAANSLPASASGRAASNNRLLARMNTPLLQRRKQYSPYQLRLLNRELWLGRPITRQIILELVDTTQLNYRQVYSWFYARIRERISPDAYAMFAAAAVYGDDHSA